MPREYWRRERRLESKAALRSRRMRMVRKPESAARSISFVIFRRVVPVRCFELKPDWKGS